MKILHVQLSHLPLPPLKYGGTERVIWALYRGQKALGHEVRFLWRRASTLPEHTIIYDPAKRFEEQIGDWPDIVHFHWPYEGELHKPFVSTEHGNANTPRHYPVNTIFLSRRHAENHGAAFWIYNGLDWQDYGEPCLDRPAGHCHFLGKAKSRLKNVQGAIEIAARAERKLHVLGGRRLVLRGNPYLCLSPNVRFHGMVGGEKKHRWIRQSCALLMPVRWHEPFGLAIIESLFLGTPVLGTPYGALPELIPEETLGLLSTEYEVLAEAAREPGQFDRRACHHWAKTRFDGITMARAYQSAYERVIHGENLNPAPPVAKRSFIDLLPVNQ